jgi:hypothetical protein
MFGRLSFLVGGNMARGIVTNELMVRVGPERYDAAVARLTPGRWTPTGANQQAALGIYPRAPDGAFQAMAIAVLTLQGGLVGQISGLVDATPFAQIGLIERVEAGPRGRAPPTRHRGRPAVC